MLEHSHSPVLIIASFTIAILAGFTGLSLTQGASSMSLGRRKILVVMSAFALGSGIWAMHFVAMLGMRMPLPFHYDALTTLVSALIAILLTGFALLIVHFGERTPWRITLAGIFTGLGIVAMHYIGMSGIQAVSPVFSKGGIVLAFVLSLMFCVASFWISYGGRGSRNIILGTLGFGLSVVSVHYIAMAGTHFVPLQESAHVGIGMSNEVLAFGVTILSFIISGSFLLVSATFATRPARDSTTAKETNAAVQSLSTKDETITSPILAKNIPYEREGRIYFVPNDEVFAVRAEGHYTFIYHSMGRLFCPWSISDFANRGFDQALIQCHRSYLMNPRHVASFQRKKDNGVCYFKAGTPLEMVPVSRSYLKAIRDHLGL